MPTTTVTFTELQAARIGVHAVEVPATIVGGAGDATWTDASDATYTQSVRTHRDFSGQDGNSAILAAIPAIPTLETLVSMEASGRFSGHIDGTPSSPIAGVFSFLQDMVVEEDGFTHFDGFSFDLQAAGSNRITVAAPDTVEAFSGLDPSSLAGAETFFREGGWVQVAAVPNFGAEVSTDYYWRVHELTIALTYDGATPPPPPTTQPVTRLYPRDSLGLASAPRLVPPPRSGRIVGGHT